MSVRTKFPNLQYTITREIDKRYNSVAWAMNDQNKCWEPDPFDNFYWPRNVPRQYTLRAFEQLFEENGYQHAEHVELEIYYEKVVIYVLNGKPTHVARQKESGVWTSKVGKCEEIEHTHPSHLESECFGIIATVLKRVRE